MDRNPLQDQFALVLGLAMGLAHKHGDEEMMLAMLSLSEAKAIARAEPHSMLASMMRSRGIDYAEAE